LTGARPRTVSASTLRPASATPDDRENVAVTVTYDDGSVGSLLYLTQGARRVPKEQLEVFGGGRTAQLDNFGLLHLYTADRKQTGPTGSRPEKPGTTGAGAGSCRPWWGPSAAGARCG